MMTARYVVAVAVLCSCGADAKLDGVRSARSLVGNVGDVVGRDDCPSSPGEPAASSGTATATISGRQLEAAMRARFDDCRAGNFLDCVATSPPLPGEPSKCRSYDVERASWATAQPIHVLRVMLPSDAPIRFREDELLAPESDAGAPDCERERLLTSSSDALLAVLFGVGPEREPVLSMYSRACFVQARAIAVRAEERLYPLLVAARKATSARCH